MIRKPFSHPHHLIAPLLLVFALGCSQAEEGPTRFALTGTVQFQGKPIPTGSISFEPDSKKGNPGPGTIAKIQDGKFETLVDKGTIGGAHNISITGYDGIPYEVPGEGTDPNGKPLFSTYMTTIELPKEPTKIELVVSPKDSK